MGTCFFQDILDGYRQSVKLFDMRQGSSMACPSKGLALAHIEMELWDFGVVRRWLPGATDAFSSVPPSSASALPETLVSLGILPIIQRLHQGVVVKRPFVSFSRLPLLTLYSFDLFVAVVATF